MSPTASPGDTCRACSATLEDVVLDLGVSPLANSYLEPEQLRDAELFLPLSVYRCGTCGLVQLPEAERPESIFSDYAYFSSTSSSWVAHARRYVEEMIARFELGPGQQVVEIASNDGYLLQFFVENDIPCLGIEPAANVAEAARERGVPTRVAFFGSKLARELAESGVRADLLLGNNVLAHVPGLSDFIDGMKALLASRGVITMEFPHLLRLVEEGQFDTVYHEHYSYFSFRVVREIFAARGLRIFDVVEVPTHGGSLRIFAVHEDDPRQDLPAVAALLASEEAAGLDEPATWEAFRQRVVGIKRGLLTFLLARAEAGESVVGYGAPAKGNTLLNYCGVGPELLAYTVDLSPHKQGRFLPGTRIPIHSPEALRREPPDWLLILPWNLRREIADQLSDLRPHGTRFVVAVPELEEVE